MIEKPKRAKQLNNQDRQLPETIQDLINRYDLDNVKIYDFLDYLSEYLNELQVETMNTRVENVDEKSSITNEKVTEIEKSVNGITQSVSAIEEKVETVESNANNAQSTADSINQNLTTNYYNKTETNSQIAQKANEITSSVATTYETKEETDTKISTTKSEFKEVTDGISAEVSKKVNDDELTGAEISLRINDDTSEVKIKGDKVDITGKKVKFKTNIETISSFTEDEYNKVIDYLNGTYELTDEEKEKFDVNKDGIIDIIDMALIKRNIEGTNIKGTFEIDPDSASRSLILRDEAGNVITSIGLLGMQTQSLNVEYFTAQNANIKNFSKLVVPCCEATTTEERELEEADTSYTIPLDKMKFNNSSFELESGGIMCPFTGTILVSAGAMFSPRNGYDGVKVSRQHIGMDKTRTGDVADHYEPAGTQKYGCIELSNRCVDVTSGEIIYLKVQSDTTGDIVTTSTRTRLTIQYVNYRK